MKRLSAPLLSAMAVSMILAIGPTPARADFELKDGDGRRILLKDDGTWKYLDEKPPLEGPPEAPPPTAEIRVAGKADTPSGCQFDLLLGNTLPYEIRSLVPEFSAIRANGVTYSSQVVAFIGIKPGGELRRSLRFGGIKCAEIDKLLVQGGDRCVMGELERFGNAKGVCLARLKVVPSELVRFEK
jgi:hypothetical protein